MNCVECKNVVRADLYKCPRCCKPLCHGWTCRTVHVDTCPGVSLDGLQAEHKTWADHNFPGRTADWALLGTLEELGELARAHQRGARGQRGGEQYQESEARKEVADVFIFLMDYVSLRGWKLSELIETRWAEVRKRDWVAHPLDGGRSSV